MTGQSKILVLGFSVISASSELHQNQTVAQLVALEEEILMGRPKSFQDVHDAHSGV
jgi:hypothetical protein